MRIRRFMFSLIVSLPLCGIGSQAQVSLVDRIPTDSRNTNYESNRAPLAPQQFIKLPTGSVRPAGWLLTQLKLQQDGLCGHLGEISAWLQKEDNAWLTQGGQWGWEEVPYWLRGYSDMAYILNDKDKIKISKEWIEAILKSQREDGNFGPVVLRNNLQDLWPNMVALWILQNYYEYTDDERVIDFMTRYFKYQMTVPDDKFLQDYWENNRGGDNMWSVVWLYNRTGDAQLLELGEKLHRNIADWTRPQALPNWHNVNIAECFREPAIYYLFSKKPEMLRATYNVQRHVRKAFGQVPGGMYGGDEVARMGYFDPRQATETCAFAEQMASDEIMLLITGDPYWAENCEDVAFNSLPAAFMPDYRSLRYLTAPNMAIGDSKNHSPGIHNTGPFLSMNPFSSRCCQHNHGFAWPYYAEHLILATPDNGAAAVLFSACEATMKVANGKKVVIKEETDYPFNETVTFTINGNAKFPFYLRIPKWAANATTKINGQSVGANVEAGKYLRIEREWKKGDRVELHLPMKVSMRHWQVNNNSVSVDYGPLTLSLEIGEKYVKRNSREIAITYDSQWQKDADDSKWPSYEIFPTTPWNYALCTDQPITLKERRPIVDGKNPFSIENAPLVFEAQGRLVPSWKIDEYGLCGVLPYEDEPRAEEATSIRLIPMGTARLRISAFPDGRR